MQLSNFQFHFIPPVKRKSCQSEWDYDSLCVIVERGLINNNIYIMFVDVDKS